MSEKGLFKRKFGRPQVFLAMIPKSPIKVISDRKRPHNHQSYRQTCLFVREDQATLKQLQLRLKLRTSRSKERASGSCQHQRTVQALIVGTSWTQKCFREVSQHKQSCHSCLAHPLTCGIVTGGGLKLDCQVDGSRYIESTDSAFSLWFAAETSGRICF